MRKFFAAAAALAVALPIAPAFAGTVLTTNATDNSGSSGATTFMNFNITGSATTYASGYGYTLTRDGGSGIFQNSGTFYSPTTNGSSGSGAAAVTYAQPAGNDGAFYGVGGVVNGVQSYATFLGTQALSSVSVYVGSLNSFNQISLLDQNGNAIVTYNGTQINGGTNPDGTMPALTATFTGTAGTTYYGASFSNVGNNSAFEFDNLAFFAAPVVAVPEPASLMVLASGIGAVAALRRRHRGVA